MRLAASLMLLTPALTLGAQAPIVVEQSSGGRAGLVAVSPVNAYVVWASGGSGTILRTVDGGTTWTPRPIPETARLNFRDIHALSADVAWVLSIGEGSASRIYHTADGGATWDLQITNTDSTAFYDCLTMFDERHGVAFSDTPSSGKMLVLRTEDGKNWKPLASGLPDALKGEGGFASSGGCVVSNGKKNGWIAAGTPDSRVFRTTDAGKSWTVATTPLLRGTTAQPGGMTAVAFRDAKNGIAVGSLINIALDTSSASVAVTSDGGKTWTLRPRRGPPGAFYGVVWVPRVGKSAAIGSTLGGLLLTRDGGASWTAVTDPNRYWAVGVAGKFAWGVGPGGRITRLEFK